MKRDKFVLQNKTTIVIEKEEVCISFNYLILAQPTSYS